MLYNKKWKSYIIPVVFLASIWSCVTTNLTEPEISNEKIHVHAQIMPHPPECENINYTYHERQNCTREKVNNFIYNNLEYPVECIGQGGEIVIINFVVDKEGNIVNPKNSRNPSCFDDAVIKVLQMMPRWIPGKHKDTIVNVKTGVRVDFDEKQHLVSSASVPLKSDNENFISPEKMAYFIECEGMTDKEKQECNKQHIIRHINSNFANSTSISLERGGPIGSCPRYMSFVIDKEGDIQHVRAGCKLTKNPDETLEQILNSMPQWIPAQHNRESVNVKLLFPYRIHPGY